MIKFPDGMHYGNFNKPGTADKRHGRAVRKANHVAWWWVAGFFILSTMLGTDALWEGLVSLGSLLFDFIQANLERFFRNNAGLDLRQAQMASAYLYFVIALIAIALLVRKVQRLIRDVRETGFLWWRAQIGNAKDFWTTKQMFFYGWWSTLDWLNKGAVIVGLTILGIPAALLLSYGLGVAVAEFF